jgi:hypothetical protein
MTQERIVKEALEVIAMDWRDLERFEKGFRTEQRVLLDKEAERFIEKIEQEEGLRENYRVYYQSCKERNELCAS